MAFIVPPPGTLGISYLVVLGRERRHLSMGAHTLINWEALLKQGAGPQDILNADARHVMAFVRDASLQPITWQLLHKTWNIDIKDLLDSRFGNTMTAECVSLLKLTTSDISYNHVDACGWNYSRWSDVFGFTPSIHGRLTL